ncbi:MAG: glycoside hydrolase family 78 protein [Lachnospiraceae bacterium]|nr:glycoside hydrolase family 78 protein [Lachnospiraceae bacterium]
MLKLYDLQVIHERNPLGIDEIPYVSWKLDSDWQNTMQQTYQIDVTDERGTYCWSSGQKADGRNCFHTFEGLRLQPKTRYDVRISVTDSHGESASESTWFETGFLGKRWEADWSCSPFRSTKRKPGFGKQQPAVIFRQKCKLKEKPVKARLYATAHGVYEAMINQQKVDDRSFAPEHTVYAKLLCYQTYDVTDAVRAGENTLDIHVGDGWYLCAATRPQMKKNDHRHAVLFQLEVEYADGSRERMVSGEHTLVAEGPIRSADLFGGELYDGRIEADQDAWSWKPCKVGNYGYANLQGQVGAPVKPKCSLAPVAILQSPKGEQIVDFGQNMAGRVRIKIDVPAGGEIILEHCEVLDKEGNFFNNIMSAGGVGKGCDQKDVYISSGKPVVYEPHFTYHGFRFVKVTGMKVTSESIRAIALSTEKEELGTFECSDASLNRLYSNICWSQRSNMLSIPTDCPQREKAGWTGDMLVYSKTAMLNEDCTSFFDRWLKNMTCDQDEYGIIPMVTPNVGSYPIIGKFSHLSNGVKGQGTSSGWGDAAVIVPYSMYEVTGDTEVLRIQYETMKRWVDYIITRCKEGTPKGCTRDKEVEQYLWDTGYHYGEWLVPSQNKNGIDMKNLKQIMASSSCYTAPIFGWYSVSTFGKIAAILAETSGEGTYTEDARLYADQAEKMKNAFCKGVITEDGMMPSDLMGAYVLPIYFDLVPEQLKERFAQKLVASIEAHDNTMDTGFLGTPYLMDSLVKIGRKDLALKLLWQRKSPSWLCEVDQGGTTIWENCFGYDEQGNPSSLSFNHYAFGCVADWIYRNVAGLDTDTPGYRHLVIHPEPDQYLTCCKRTFMTEQGLSSVHWTLEDQNWNLEVEIPCNATADIILPNGEVHKVGSGKYHFACVIGD